MKYDVIVMGSINMDTMLYVNNFPKRTENMIVNEVKIFTGGKGANQAIAVSKQEVNQAFIGAIGNDSNGKEMLIRLKEQGIETNHIIVKDNVPTGSCVGIIEKNGENTLLVIPGANMEITCNEIEEIFSKLEGKIFLLQLETSKESILTALKKAKEKGMYIILDPAPEGCYFEEALQYADLVTPNKQETEKITGLKITNIEDAKNAALLIHKKGVKNVIVKLGEDGSVLYEEEKQKFSIISPIKVNAVDTVGAGDTFAGVLAARLSEGNFSLEEAVKIANKAAALKVSRLGGQAAIPTREEIDKI